MMDENSPPRRPLPQPNAASFQDPSVDAAINIIHKNRRRTFVAGLGQSEVFTAVPPTTGVGASIAASTGSAELSIDAHPPSVEVPTRSTVGRAVIQRIDDIHWIGRCFVDLLDGRIAALKVQRLNSDEAIKDIADLEDLKRRVEEFLASASQFARNNGPEQLVEKAHVSFVESLKNYWDQRHIQIGDMGLVGLGAWLLHTTDPLSVLTAGTIVGGPKFVDAIKAWKGTK